MAGRIVYRTIIDQAQRIAVTEVIPVIRADAAGCTGDENCVIGVHQTDCCGSSYAYGFNHSERDRFDTLEPPCRATYPGCGCPAGPTQTDSGETATDASTIQVACVAQGPERVCVTYVTMRPPDLP